MVSNGTVALGFISGFFMILFFIGSIYLGFFTDHIVLGIVVWIFCLIMIPTLFFLSNEQYNKNENYKKKYGVAYEDRPRITCDTCHGEKGGPDGYKDWRSCSHCNGKGFILT